MFALKQFNDETLPNFTKRKHPRKGEKKKQRGGPKSRQVNSPTQVGHKEVREQPSLHQSLEAYQLKKWEA
jgi:hypothetical protein